MAVRRALQGGATVLALPGALPPPQEPLTAWLATKEVAEAMKEVMQEEQSVEQLFFGGWPGWPGWPL